jgi:hexosaminidase
VRDAAGKPAVRMTTELSGCDIYYTFDGTNPDSLTPKYAGEPVPIPGDASVVKAVAWRGGHPSGRVLTLTLK